VTIFARDLNKAKPLADEFGAALEEFGDAQKSFGDFDILVNSTPLGMTGKGAGQTPATAEQLTGLDLVYDLVYVPFQTPLMDEADKAEVPKIGGFAMLIAQALEQQRIWTGLEPPMKEMSRAALARLK
jgi:shikimate 5-dehydrogenase